MFVLVKTDREADPPYKGMTCFIGEKEPGAPRTRASPSRRKIKKMGYKGVESTELVFDGYKLPGREHPRRRGGRASARASSR